MIDEYVSYVSDENNSPQLSSDDLFTTNNHNNAHPANMHENNDNNTVVSSIVHTHAERQHKQCKEKQLRKDFRMHMAVGDPSGIKKGNMRSFTLWSTANCVAGTPSQSQSTERFNANVQKRCGADLSVGRALHEVGLYNCSLIDPQQLR